MNKAFAFYNGLLMKGVSGQATRSATRKSRQRGRLCIFGYLFVTLAGHYHTNVFNRFGCIRTSLLAR